MTILEEINEVKKEEVKKLKRDFTYSRFEDSEYFAKQKLSLTRALNNADRISIIAEIKKSSPSKGIIREDFNHLNIADIYLQNGADAISVLTDLKFFQGSINYLNEIAKFKTIPLLRKDFIIDEYQIYEAKSNGADAILLIAESLSANQINELTSAAEEIDLDVLLELHSANQTNKIDFSKNKIIGINNRDLSSFKVELDTINKISHFIPSQNILVAESGINTKEDIEFIKHTRSNAILVGEHLMSAVSIEDSLSELVSWCKYEN